MTNPIERIAEARALRPTKTKTQLLEELDACDEAYLNNGYERDMAEAYYKTLEKHLRESHGCGHDFAAVANGDE